MGKSYNDPAKGRARDKFRDFIHRQLQKPVDKVKVVSIVTLFAGEWFPWACHEAKVTSTAASIGAARFSPVKVISAVTSVGAERFSLLKAISAVPL